MAARQGADGEPEEREQPGYVRVGNAMLVVAEDAIYVGIAAVLAVAGAVLLVSAASGLTKLGGDTATSEVVISVLDTLLLVFIVVELLFAVRYILGKREVVAEPFLVVGIIASIKEIIVLSVEAAGYVGKERRFENAILEIGVLGVLVVALAAAAIMLRAKEREPQEGERDASGRRLSRDAGDGAKD